MALERCFDRTTYRARLNPIFSESSMTRLYPESAVCPQHFNHEAEKNQSINLGIKHDGICTWLLSL